MDDETFGHFEEWCFANLRDDELDEVSAAMLKAYNEMDDDDKQRTLDHGWTHLRDLVRVR